MSLVSIRFLLLLCLASLHLLAKAQDRPNIIIFMADDISHSDLGCYGHPVIQTPNIDLLASNGIRFDNAFLTTSSCSPSRISIITGRYPHNTGAAELHTPVPKGQVVFPKLLRDAGYYTAQAGKWHFGPSALEPGDAMFGAFDRVGGSLSEGGGESGAEKWVEYVKQRPRDQPFFMWFAAHDAHRDWDDEWVPIKYEPSQVVVPASLRDTQTTREDLASYYQEVSRFDFFIGETIKALKEQQVLDNTLIIVMADNGRAFPRNKTRMYDEGIKTPFVVHWPKGMRKYGAASKSLLSAIDIAPTLLDVAGVPLSSTFQGKSFKPVLSDPDRKFRNFIFAEHNWHDFQAFERMVRTERFLYIENGLPSVDNRGAIDVMGRGAGTELQKGFEENTLTDLQRTLFAIPQPRHEFYDCETDPQQASNLFGQAVWSKEQKKLAKVLGKWKVETGDSQPINLTPDWYDRVSNEPLPEKETRGEMPGAVNRATENDRPGPF